MKFRIVVVPMCHDRAFISHIANKTKNSAKNTLQIPFTVRYPTGALAGSSNSCFRPFTAAWKNRSAMRVPKVSPENLVKAWMYSLALTAANTKCIKAVKISTHAQNGRNNASPISLLSSQYLNM